AGLSFCVFCLIAFFRLLESKASLIWRSVLFLSLIGIQSYAMLTWSRGPIYSLWGGYIILWLLRRDWRTTTLVTVLGLAAAGIGLSSGMISIQQESATDKSEQVSTHDISSEDQLNETFNQRGSIWYGTFEQSMEAPWFGHGANSEFNVPFNNGKNIAQHAHNLYLQTLYETGFIGLILFILLYALSAKDCWKFRKDTLMQLSIAFFVFGVLGFASDVSRIFRQPDPYWLLFWLPLGITIGIRLREQLGMIKIMPDVSKKETGQ
ncbi:MAG: O-antigen ligase family protein, partial [Endozoicomonas sp.]